MRLGVNIDHVATVRQVRNGIEPDPVYAALISLSAGADSIVAHLREDRRHINERDVFILRQVVRAKLNLEMSVAQDIVEIACSVKPDQATLVPEKRREITTEGGLDLTANYGRIKQVIAKLSKCDIEVSLFIDPVKKQIDAAKRSGVNSIELHTGRFCDAKTEKEQNKYFLELKKAAQYGKGLGLKVFAGHGLNYFNARQVAGIKEIEELNIGYSIICRAVLAGLDQAVKEMKALIS